jgi:redox-sensitive bicupin YhaK (pirin superfamily)
MRCRRTRRSQESAKNLVWPGSGSSVKPTMTNPSPELVEIRRADQRFHTRLDWLDSWHSFSFGPHRDPTNVGHGLLVVNNDDTVRGGGGFATHAHRDMEIVTWVVSGELEHHDSAGNDGIIYPGLAQRMSAGSGIRHSERNPSSDRDVHFVQMWVVPDTEGVPPSYQQLDISAELARGQLVPIASGAGDDTAISLHQRQATLLGGRLPPGGTGVVPDAPHVHVFVARHEASLEGAGELAAGDAVRLTEAGARRLDAGPAGAEVLVWATA